MVIALTYPDELASLSAMNFLVSLAARNHCLTTCKSVVTVNIVLRLTSVVVVEW